MVLEPELWLRLGLGLGLTLVLGLGLGLTLVLVLAHQEVADYAVGRPQECGCVCELG